MATASVRWPTAAASDPRRNLPFSSLFHRSTTPPPDQYSPTSSTGPGGLIYRDERDAPVDLLTMMPNTLRDSSPGAPPIQNPVNPAGNATYPRQNRVPAPPMDESLNDLDSQPKGISPANSLRRIPRENRGSSGSLNELGIDPAALGAAREKDRPSSRDRERRDTVKSGSPMDKSDSRKASGNMAPNGSGPIRPSPYSFDSGSTLKLNHSTPDLLSFGNIRDSPSYDTSALAGLDPLQNDSPGGATGSMAKKQGSGDSLDLPNGEHGGWVSYDSADPSTQAQTRNAEWERKAYTASRFSPDRFPLSEEDRDEEILSIPRTTSQQNRGYPSQSSPSQPTQPAQTRRRDLPGIPGQPNHAAPSHSREPSGQQHSPGVVPVPKTQHSNVIASQWTRRPSSPLAREPVVANNSSSEDTDSYTPRSPHAQLPEIPSVSGSYISNGSPQVSPQYSQPSQPSHQYTQQSQQSPSMQQNPHLQQQAQNTRSMPPPALANNNRTRQNQTPYHDQYRGMPQMQLPMYTGASMATALSSISPSQSVSAVGSPHPRNHAPIGPPFGPPSNVFITEGRNAKQQMYPILGQQMPMKNSGRQNLNYSLDSTMAALTNNYTPLNAANLSALKSLTAHDLRALGFGKDQPATAAQQQQLQQQQQQQQPQQQPGSQNRGAQGQQPNQRRGLIDGLDKAAGEVVELQDLQRAMEMNLDEWNGRDWARNMPAHTGNSAQYPSSHAVLPPGDRAKAKAAEEYERQLQQLNALAANPYSSSSNMHPRPGNPIPPTPFSATGPNGQAFPRVLPNGEGWIPVPNTDGYPPSYGEIMSLYEQLNPGKQPSMRDVLMMQLAALASEPENVEGSVFSKTESAFPPVGYNPFIQAQNQQHGMDSVRSSPRDPPGEFDKMLRRVGTFNQPPRRAVASSVFGGDEATEVSHMAPSTATERTIDDDGTTTEDDNHSTETAGAGGLRLNFDNSTQETLNGTNINGTNGLGMNPAMNASSSTINENTSLNSLNNGMGGSVVGHPSALDSYSQIIGMLKSRAASVAPGAHYVQQQQQMNSATSDGSQWVEETDSDEDIEAEMEAFGDEEAARLHPRFIRDETKRRRKWEIKFAELVKAFHELDRLTDTPMILLATPPRSSAQGGQLPVSHIALSRSIKRDRGWIQRAHEARQSYHNILTTPATSRAGSYQSMSSPSLSPPMWGGPQLGQGWGSGSATSLSDADAQMRAQMLAALSSLKFMDKVEAKREERRRQEAVRQKDERDAVERMLKNLLTGASASQAGSAGKGSVSAGSPAGGSVADRESVGVPSASEDTTPPAHTMGNAAVSD